jgi:hypothetical protein
MRRARGRRFGAPFAVFHTILSCAVGAACGFSFWACAGPTAQTTVRSSPWPQLSARLVKVGGGEGDAAVIVGVEHYKFLAPVAGATDNAIDWETYFTEMRGIPRDRVQRLTGDDATDYGIERAVKAAAKAVQPGGKLWFVFIGHGAPTKRETTACSSPWTPNRPWRG